MGLNQSIPQATNDQLTEDKMKAYQLGADEEGGEQMRQSMGQLSDYFDKETEHVVNPQAQAGEENHMERSVRNYQVNHRIVSSFYEPAPHDTEKEDLKQEIADLKTQLAEKEENEEDKQLSLMERSY